MSSPSDLPAAALPRRPRRPLGRFAMLGLLGLLVVVFSLVLPNTFPTAANASTILTENAILAMLALAVMLPLIVNEFDLSVAAVMGFAAMLAAGMPERQGVPAILVLGIVLLVGAAVGVVHAVLIVRFELPSFVVTLGTNSVFAGLILLYSNGAVIYEAISPVFTALGATRVAGIGLPVFLLAALALVLWFVLDRRPVGRRLYATGANEMAARLAGIPTQRYRAAALIAAPVLAAFVGVILVGRLGSASPTSFTAYFLPAFAAAFLSVAGYRLGQFNTLGVVTAVYLLAVGVSGLSLLGVPSWMEPIFDGVALVVAIGLAKLLTVNRRGRARSAAPSSKGLDS